MLHQLCYWLLPRSWLGVPTNPQIAFQKLLHDSNRGIEFIITDDDLGVSVIGGKSPVIYDNDKWLDVIDTTNCAAGRKLGNIDLKDSLSKYCTSNGNHLRCKSG